ncbi:MAG: hypothetical protein IT462_10540 [Planctomycetes bacterium]|nr:hypothetical protein [Planctomycetota bacterium]
MQKIAAALPALVLAASLGVLALAGSGCDGKFAGPPAGSVTGTPGTDPLFGVTVFTFTVENWNETGFYNDVWYIDPGLDTDDGPTGQPNWVADTITVLQVAGMKGWITGDPAPTHIEVNNQYPLMLSFMSQWYRRNADGTRIRERDQFGQIQWSPKSLNINFLTAPVRFRQLPGNPFPIRIWDVLRSQFPAGIPGSMIFLWNSQPHNSPGDFPSPVRQFLSKQFSEVGTVLIDALVPSGSPQLTNALGVAIQDSPGSFGNPNVLGNENTETIGTIPRNVGGGPAAVPIPTGVFGDKFAKAYRAAPVVQYDSPGHDPIEAVVEYCRHCGALHSNLICQCIGLISNEAGTIMDTKQVIFQNGYPYAFAQKDVDTMSKLLLPGKGRDPRPPAQQNP